MDIDMSEYHTYRYIYVRHYHGPTLVKGRDASPFTLKNLKKIFSRTKEHIYRNFLTFSPGLQRLLKYFNRNLGVSTSSTSYRTLNLVTIWPRYCISKSQFLYGKKTIPYILKLMIFTNLCHFVTLSLCHFVTLLLETFKLLGGFG